MNKDPADSETRMEKTIAVLFDIANAVFHTRSLKELYRAIHTSLGTILAADNFFIALHDEAGDEIQFPYFTDEINSPPVRLRGFSRSTSLIRSVIQSKEAMIFSEKASLEKGYCLENPSRIPKIWMGAPLLVRKRIIGVIAVQDYASETAYTIEDLTLLKSVSQHVALAIERKEAEARIQDQGQILEKILESSPVGIALVENRVFKWVNSEMVRMFGYASKDEFQDQSVKMIYQAEADFEFAGKTIYQGFSEKGKADYEMDLIRSDNSLFPVHIRLNSTDSNDPMSWTIGTFTDISERRTAEKDAFERERLQGVLEMAGAVCHEINQPLQAIIGYAELMDMGQDPALTEASLKSIKSQVTRLGKITETLANITQYKTLEYPGETKIVDIWGTGR